MVRQLARATGDEENRGFRISGPAVALVVPVQILLN